MADSNVLVLPQLLDTLTSDEPEQAALRRLRPLRVLFAIHTARDPHTAVYNNTCERAEYLEKLGHHCTIVTPEDFPWLQIFGARFTPLLFPMALAWHIARIADPFDIAFFHSHAGWALSIVKRLFRGSRDLRVAIMFHGLEPLYFARLETETPLSFRFRLMHRLLMHRLLRLSCRHADRILCLNSDEQHYLVLNRWAGRDRIAVIPNSAPKEFFIGRRHAARATRLLFVGQWLPMKGVRYLVEAFTTLNREDRDLKLTVAGTLVPASEVIQAFPLDVRPHVSVYPRLNRAALVELHQEADIFVFPTLSEGFSLALAEAMASGLPIVTTRVGAAGDVLRHFESTLFIPTRDSDAIVACIRRLLHDCHLRERLGRAAQSRAELLCPEKCRQQFRTEFERLATAASTTEATLAVPSISGTRELCR